MNSWINLTTLSNYNKISLNKQLYVTPSSNATHNPPQYRVDGNLVSLRGVWEYKEDKIAKAFPNQSEITIFALPDSLSPSGKTMHFVTAGDNSIEFLTNHANVDNLTFLKLKGSDDPNAKIVISWTVVNDAEWNKARFENAVKYVIPHGTTYAATRSVAGVVEVTISHTNRDSYRANYAITNLKGVDQMTTKIQNEIYDPHSNQFLNPASKTYLSISTHTAITRDASKTAEYFGHLTTTYVKDGSGNAMIPKIAEVKINLDGISWLIN